MRRKLMTKGFAAAITAMLVLISLLGSTYAWFSANRVVSTEEVRAATGQENLELQLSSDGGENFSPQDPADIVQVNIGTFEMLMPVSTYDLQSFVYNPVSNSEGKAEKFKLLESERYIYHGRFYMRALSVGDVPGQKLAVYFDQSEIAGGPIGTSRDDGILNAARLGIVIGENEPVILKLSRRSNPGSNQVLNTVVDGNLLGDNTVLDYNGGIQPKEDPSKDIDDYTIVTEGENISLPAEPLAYINYGEIYKVDVYFYLEGCDPDCSDYIRLKARDMHLAFYGIAE